ncbi:hypothetical protein CN977_24955 [Bacillus thuringiensis]|uniref:hypothetical protein n=1 Tax=Bacillus cereus group TaxID=86661 RepID=UPI000BFD037F|nr:MULTISPECIES: hypothetical protein [Bacillus cereus group]MBJ7935330.1 hypothetical protein [Bacillus cereus]MED2490370.1 hypothetical protein [Bacillus thuringiensis]PGO37881.1 hypothetical protein CN977_24955 [Bacillus thuringiensis]QGV08517.1 hypothetical protein GNE09_17700 [Bacillus cereus]
MISFQINLKEIVIYTQETKNPHNMRMFEELGLQLFDNKGECISAEMTAISLKNILNRMDEKQANRIIDMFVIGPY